MNVEKKLLDRFTELCQKGDELMKSPSGRTGELNIITANQWGISCLHLLKKVFGSESPHFLYFESYFGKGINQSLYAQQALGIFRAATEDFEKELLFDARNLIEAEVFENFLEQAEYLERNNFLIPSAVMAGFVLEDAVRRLCVKSSITFEKSIDKVSFDEMNTALVKAGIYNKTTQKLNIASYGIRTDAAHGKKVPVQNEVNIMIQQIRNFLSNYYH